MSTCTTCKYYDMTTPKEIEGVVYHPCKRNAPIVQLNSYDELGCWPMIDAQTPVCGEYKKK